MEGPGLKRMGEDFRCPPVVAEVGCLPPFRSTEVGEVGLFGKFPDSVCQGGEARKEGGRRRKDGFGEVRSGTGRRESGPSHSKTTLSKTFDKSMVQDLYAIFDCIPSIIWLALSRQDDAVFKLSQLSCDN